MKKLYTVLALCASFLVATADTGKPAAKKPVKAPIKKECCKKGGDDCCKKSATSAIVAKKAAPKKS